MVGDDVMTEGSGAEGFGAGFEAEVSWKCSAVVTGDAFGFEHGLDVLDEVHGLMLGSVASGGAEDFTAEGLGLRVGDAAGAASGEEECAEEVKCLLAGGGAHAVFKTRLRGGRKALIGGL